ncbi:MAG: tRNA uridine-5-carboxymethylaminomethyl(34) synthesis GTPase MnmE [Paludibacteraceae bacterium]|nr:tRNA uridine-5-carboxymethylaminomethyl(34) synthesis GTPase MnmE [Paludibacteraceae bacterium]
MNIAAIATAPGTGGIAVIRISGPDAFTITDTIFRARNPKRTIATAEAYTMLFGNIVNEITDNRAQITDNQTHVLMSSCIEKDNNVGTQRAASLTSDASQNSQLIVDEVVVAIFRAPHSFTGENTVEISCHGSIYIQQEILRLLISAGARMAGPGEFTQRAFLNGRLDLSQAEAVADLINAQSAAAHTIALNQMRGNFSSKLEELRRQLLHFVSLLELELDFGDHDDLEFADRTELNSVANEIRSQLTRLQQTFSQGNAIKNGIPVAIVGETNAGKSTLLNLLVGDNRAIVSDIHGTTRDVIEDTVNINGLTFRFIDTAGIRQTSDIIENLGIERTYEMIERAQIILWVIDSTNVTEHIEWLAERIMHRTQGKRLIILLNKIDRLNEEELTTLRQWFEPYCPQSRDAACCVLSVNDRKTNPNDKKSFQSVPSVGDKIAGEATANSVNSVRDTTPQIIEISAKQNLNTECLTSLLYENAQMPDLSAGDIIISNLRHYEALTLALDSIDRVIEGLQMGIPADFVAQDIRQALFHLAEITGGEITTDEVLGNIFAHFCIGK